jgi:hypothetical protein
MKEADKMERWLNRWLRPVPELPAWKFYLRCLWVVVQVVAAYWFSSQVSPFFYQQF